LTEWALLRVNTRRAASDALDSRITPITAFARGVFSDSEEALESALAFARAIIDGKVLEHTVEDL
jgi:hypothetical protein